MELNRQTPPPPAIAIRDRPGRPPVDLQRLQMHARQCADDFQVAEFLSADIHQQIFAFGIVAVQP